MNNITFRKIGALNESVRDAWVTAELSALAPGLRILDAGAGECRYRNACSHLAYVSQDFSQYNGSGDSTGLQTGTWDTSRIDIVSDIVSIPSPDASFDAILCTEVLEHLPDPSAALKEFARLLKPGGVLILTAPFCSLTHFAPYHFAPGFNRHYYEKILPEYGISVDSLQPNGNYFEFLAQEIRRISSVSERYAGGPAGLLTRAVAKLLLLLLVPLARRDKGSSELLCFGWHIRGVKR